MLKRLRLNLTVVCAMITGTILIIMAILVLYISEKALNERSHIAFQSIHNSIVYRIQNDKIISQTWLSQTESDNQLIISVEDNTNQFLFKGSWQAKTNRETLIDKAKTIIADKYKFDLYANPISSINTEVIFFELIGEEKEQYYASTTIIPSEYGKYSLILIHDRQYEYKQIIENRFLFFSLALIGIVLLIIFSWWFAGRAIIPIEKSRKKQVEFIAVASHELKAPLAVITTSTSALQKLEASEQARFITAVQKECRRMARLVDDLLLLSNADANTWSIKNERVEIDTVLIETIDLFSSLANSHKQKLNLSLPIDAVSVILGDSERILQAVSILIDNALHYTPDGAKVNIYLTEEQHFIIIKISDSGLGISDEDKKHIFDRFYRVDKSHNEKDHYGLGLSIANEIVALHKGSISVCDTIGGGATFIIKLPIY